MDLEAMHTCKTPTDRTLPGRHGELKIVATTPTGLLVRKSWCVEIWTIIAETRFAATGLGLNCVLSDIQLSLAERVLATELSAGSLLLTEPLFLIRD